MKIELSAKMIELLIDAINFRLQAYDAEMSDNKISEDRYSDIGNDAQLLKIIKEDFENYRHG